MEWELPPLPPPSCQEEGGVICERIKETWMKMKGKYYTECEYYKKSSKCTIPTSHKVYLQILQVIFQIIIA